MQTQVSLSPFSRSHELCHDLDTFDLQSKNAVTLPGYPSVMLSDLTSTEEFLEQELWSQQLETIAPRLWVMSTLSHRNINALHHQLIKGRKILVTEDPKLHLVWIKDRIFIKPLPRYLLSHKFWEVLRGNSTLFDDRRKRLRHAALGFLRTYVYLIRHESDFVIAQQDHLRLIPQEVRWADFYVFASDIQRIGNDVVSQRYWYGELRLSRLNLYAPFFFRKAYFEQVHQQYGDYFARLYGPVLFTFAILTTLMNSMQVELAVEQVSSNHWVALQSAWRWFSVFSLVLTAIIAACFAILWSWMVLDEWVFAVKSRLRRGPSNDHVGA